MDFGFTEEQETLRQTIRDFARKEIQPRAKEWDRERKYPWPIVRRFAQLGLAKHLVDFVSTGIAIEEIAYADFNCAFPILFTAIPYGIYRLEGVPEEVAGPLRDGMAAGEKVASICFTEPGTGSDFANIATTATRTEDGWVIDGCKNSVSFAGIADAYIVWARTENQKSIWAFSSFLVPRGLPGVSAPELWDDMGTRGTPRGVVHFDNVHIPSDYLIGALGRGFEHAAELYDTNRALIGLLCAGPARASIDETVEYAKKREVSGNPISRYQAISFALAEGYTLLEAARLLCYKTLWMADKDVRHSVEGAMCKWWVPEISFDIVRKCLLIHGHYGYTTDLPFEQRLRDILGWHTGDGTQEVSKLIIARNLFGGKEFTG